jgi:hypothetical protein
MAISEEPPGGGAAGAAGDGLARLRPWPAARPRREPENSSRWPRYLRECGNNSTESILTEATAERRELAEAGRRARSRRLPCHRPPGPQHLQNAPWFGSR